MRTNTALITFLDYFFLTIILVSNHTLLGPHPESYNKEIFKVFSRDFCI